MMESVTEERIKSMHHLCDEVAEVLEKYPQTRNSDKLLIVMVLKKYYHVETINDILRSDVPTTEGIRRARQRLQEEGLYQSLEQTAKVREYQEEVMRKFSKRSL
jgi:U3 small nucleolar RNA-associated protein 14